MSIAREARLALAGVTVCALIIQTLGIRVAIAHHLARLAVPEALVTIADEARLAATPV